MFPLKITKMPENNTPFKGIHDVGKLWCPIMFRSDNFINTPIITDISVGLAIAELEYSAMGRRMGLDIRRSIRRRNTFVLRAAKIFNELPYYYLKLSDSIIPYEPIFVVPLDTDDDEPIFGSSNKLVDKFKKVCYNVCMMLEKREKASKSIGD